MPKCHSPSRSGRFSTLKGDARADLVGGRLRRDVVQPLRVERKTERSPDAGTERLDVACSTNQPINERTPSSACCSFRETAHTRTESKDARVVDLRLDERGAVEVDLGADLERDVARGRRAGVVHGLGAGLDVGADAVVVARGVRGEVGEPVEGDGVLGGTVAEGSSVTSDLALSNVVRGLGTEEETVTTENSVSSESGALKVNRLRQ